MAKRIEQLSGIIACPYDREKLDQSESGLRCSFCGKSFPIINGTVNFLPYDSAQAVYDIPWHPVPKQNLKSRLIARLRRMPIYWRLFFTSDHFSLALERLLFRLIGRSSAVIDIGCREGTNLLYAPQNSLCVGVDIDLSSVQFADAMTPDNCYAFLASGTLLPFRDESFDCIVCTDVIEHVDLYQKLVEEISRIGRSHSCTLVLTTPDGDILPKPGELHFRHFKKKELDDLLRPHFSELKIRSIPRNCNVKRLRWRFLNRFGHRFFAIYLILNTVTNILYYLAGYHRAGSESRKDIGDSTFIIGTR